jgi:uncharacterized membrane protein YhaH (DUF805 family)
MDYKWLLFGFEGRVNRASYWFCAPIIFCWAAVVAVLLYGIARIFGHVETRSFAFDTSDLFRMVDPRSYRLTFDALHTADPAALVSFLYRVIVTPVVLWCYAAVSIKRLHDRNKSAWWTLPFFVLPGLFNQFESRLGDSIPVIAIGAILSVTFLWGFIETGFLSGTQGPNRFGPDPLAPVDTRPDWDQQSELEFVPHKAGPAPGPHVIRGP